MKYGLTEQEHSNIARADKDRCGSCAHQAVSTSPTGTVVKELHRGPKLQWSHGYILATSHRVCYECPKKGRNLKVREYTAEQCLENGFRCPRCGRNLITPEAAISLGTCGTGLMYKVEREAFREEDATWKKIWYVMIDKDEPPAREPDPCPGL